MNTKTPFPSNSFQRLDQFKATGFPRGRSLFVEVLWRIVQAIIFQSKWFPFYGPKRLILRSFGAKIGRKVLIKPRVTITFPWKLHLGDHVWIGEGVWIDSLEEVTIESNVCISQNAYLCTGSHDYRRRTFDLICKPIRIREGAWVCAESNIAPGIEIGANAVCGMGSVVTKDVPQNAIVFGNPAEFVRWRTLREPYVE